MVIDAKGHLVGRLASIVAKQLLQGQKVVVVRCELLEVTGGLQRNRFKYLRYIDKRMNTNPSRGPFHFRAPSRMFHKAVRGMLPRKTSRGEAALERLKVFEGVPPPYDKKKKLVVPDALRVIRLRPERKTTVLGELAGVVGWKYGAIIKTLEEKRKAKGKVYHDRQQLLLKAKAKAEAKVQANIKNIDAQLQVYGH